MYAVVGRLLEGRSLFSFICMPRPQCHHRRKTVLEAFCIRICESVRPENIVNTVSQNPVKGILPNFGHKLIWLRRYADNISGSKGQRSRSQQAKA